jgi:predicted phage terminase large subunit-like protein
MTVKISDRRRRFNAALAKDLFIFLERAFRDLDPRNRLLVVPFVELLIEGLHQVENGTTRRLIINLPPRHLKSVLVSIVFPAWLLGRDPRLRIAVISHSQGLARDLALRTRLLVQARWYREAFPRMRLRPDRSGSMDFETSQGGGRYAASLDTGVTGRGFDIIIVDDPLSAQDARSAAERGRVKEAYDSMIASRIDDPARSAIIIVHQRLHEDDLTGHLLPQGDWHHISLPLVAEEEVTYAIGKKLWARKIGEALLPDLYPSPEIDKIRARGPAIFAAQYQQDPTASIGELLHPDHIRDFDVLPADARRITLSFDTATKTTESASYTVCLVIASDGRRHYVIDVLRQRLDPVQARDAAVRLIQHYKPNQILIEDASSGPGLGQMLGELGHRSELRSTRGRGKEDRFEAHLHVFVDGRILVKRDQVWTTALVDEWLRFPFARYDDQVDAMSQYLEWVSDHRLANPVLRGAGGADERAARALWGPPPRKGEHPMRPRSRGRQSAWRIRPR